MTRFLKLAQMLIGGAALLLFAGGFPRMGVPAIYQSGAMLLLGVIGMGFAFFAGLRIARGGMVGFLRATFYALLAMACAWACLSIVSSWYLIVVGILLLLLFSYLTWRNLEKRYSLAWAHLALIPVAFGAYLDHAFEINGAVPVVVDSPDVTDHLQLTADKQAPFGFSLALHHFDLTHYESHQYDIYQQDGREWKLLGKMRQKEEMLYYEGENWSISELQHDAKMGKQAFLFIDSKPMRLILEGEPTIKEYKVDYTLNDPELEEEKRGVLRVNEPIEHRGWQFSMMNYRVMEQAGQTIVHLEARHAPGRFWARSGMFALIISIASWCWIPQRRKEQSA